LENQSIPSRSASLGGTVVFFQWHWGQVKVKGWGGQGMEITRQS